jgi:hypothetical protein
VSCLGRSLAAKTSQPPDKPLPHAADSNSNRWKPVWRQAAPTRSRVIDDREGQRIPWSNRWALTWDGKRSLSRVDSASAGRCKSHQLSLPDPGSLSRVDSASAGRVKPRKLPRSDVMKTRWISWGLGLLMCCGGWLLADHICQDCYQDSLAGLLWGAFPPDESSALAAPPPNSLERGVQHRGHGPV